MVDRSIEERLAAVERDLAKLKGQMKKPNWISAIRGTAKGNETYAEISRLGKQMRDAETEPEE